ncbi:MAG: hypothetical protein ABIH21_05475 [Patescibacteria group bacterium]
MQGILEKTREEKLVVRKGNLERQQEELQTAVQNEDGKEIVNRYPKGKRRKELRARIKKDSSMKKGSE